VLNKCDKLSSASLSALAREFPEAILMSARSRDDVSRLRELLVAFFERGMGEHEVFVPYSQPKAMGPLRTSFRVLSERHDEEGTWLRVRAHSEDLSRARERLDL
jgi:GTP-binding protein HflX